MDAFGPMAQDTNSKPTSTEFLRRLIGDTTSLVSGGMSVPFTMLSIFSDSKYTKASFGVLAVTGFVIASYRLWAGERRNTLAMQEMLTEEINKRGRPEITVELKGDGGGTLHACLMNYASIAAINIRIDDIPCGDGVLRFENIPTTISSGFSPNLQCYFVPPDGSPKRRDIVQELIFAKSEDSELSKYILAIRYTDSDGVLDWVTKCDFAYDFKQKKIALLKQWIEDGEAESAIRELRNYTQGGSPDQRAIKWLSDAGYVEATEVTHLQSPEREFLITGITDKGKRLLKTKPVNDAQAKLLAAQLEEIEARKKARQREEEHEARMKFLTAPDTGIRRFVATETTRKNCTQAFTVDMLASSLSSSKAEIEEALGILRSRGFAKETSLAGHWFIQS
jgi:hypothetical protein